jgi:hypothetical protein
MPHPHSLFLLADHHHEHDGSLDEHEHEHEHGAAASRQGEVAGRGPVVQSVTPEGAFGEQISLAIEECGAAARTGVSEPLIWPLDVPLASIGEAPEPPPPRSVTHIL